MKIKPQIAILSSILFVIAGILVTNALGLWQTSMKLPPAPPPQTSETTYNPKDIRGSYTMGEVSSLYLIPLSDLAKAFTIPEGQASSFQVKSLETLFDKSEMEVGTASVRLFVAWYLGVDYAMTEEVFLPDPAAKILLDKGTLSDEQMTYLQEHTLALQP